MMPCECCGHEINSLAQTKCEWCGHIFIQTNNTMMQIVEMSHDDKKKMYSKLSKKELIEMLIESNRHLAMIQPQIIIQQQPVQVQPYVPYQPYPSPFYTAPFYGDVTQPTTIATVTPPTITTRTFTTIGNATGTIDLN